MVNSSTYLPGTKLDERQYKQQAPEANREASSKDKEAAAHQAELDSMPFKEEVDAGIKQMQEQMHAQTQAPKERGCCPGHKQNSPKEQTTQQQAPQSQAPAPEVQNPMDVLNFLAEQAKQAEEAMKGLGLTESTESKAPEKSQPEKTHLDDSARKDLLAEGALSTFVKGMPNTSDASAENEQKIITLLTRALKLPQEKLKELTDFLLRTPLVAAGLTNISKNLQSFSNALGSIKLSSINPLNTDVKSYFRNVGKLIGPAISLQPNAGAVINKLEDLTNSGGFFETFQEKGFLGGMKHYGNKLLNWVTGAKA